MALSLFAGRAFAQEKPTLGLEVESACPNQSLIEAALAPLLRDYRLVTGPASRVAHIRDWGESYSVSVDGASREVTDPDRRCWERARVVAVFLLLSLSESTAGVGDVVTQTEPAPTKLVSAPRMPPAEAPLPTKIRHSLALRSFVRVEVAPASRLVATSVGLGASVRRGPLALSFLGGLATPTHPGQEDGAASRLKLWRFPFSLLLGWEAGTGSVGFGVEAGPSVDILHFEGERVPRATTGTRLNLGLGVNAMLRLRASQRWQADLGPTFSYFPRTYLARIEPGPVLAETPLWWAGLSLGLRYSVWER
jgi:hypothetical protein